MAIDVYQLCPCGSGKKLKFCCFPVADEIEKAVRLQENNQPRAALQIVDRLRKEHAELPWVAIAGASLLMNEGMLEEARDRLKPLLDKDAEHPMGLVLNASVAFALDGYDAARPAIYRAFQRSRESAPDLVAGLAVSIATEMLGADKAMAARQHLALAMRLVSGKDQEEIFLRLLDFDGNREIPYPLRSVHQLGAWADGGTEEEQRDARKAMKLAALGCFEPAARIFTRLAEQHPEAARLWQNAGFCRAWHGDESGAAYTLHEAARRHADFETAVECETIAQLLDLSTTADRALVELCQYDVKSVSRLLSRLDEHDRLVRLDLEDSGSSNVRQEALYLIVDRPETEVPDTDHLTRDAIPNIIGQVRVVADRDTDSSLLILANRSGTPLETLEALISEVAGGEIAPKSEEESRTTVRSLPCELAYLDWNWHFPRGTPLAVRGRFMQEQWRHVIDEVWPARPMMALEGRTPQEAAGIPELRLPLRSAVHVLDAWCDQRKHPIDVPALCRRLRLDEPQPIELREDLPLQTFSAMQLHRLPIAGLDDGQLGYVLNRALLIHHGGFLYAVLREVVNRPPVMEKAGSGSRVYGTLADLSREQGRSEESLEWIARARERAGQEPNAFQGEVAWSLRELAMRLDDPNDPGLEALLRRFAEHYCVKLPQLANEVRTLLNLVGIDSPWFPESGEAPGGPAGETTPAGLWVPEAASQEEGPKKLWVPGQD